jgi:hypothetical protein
VVLPREAGKEDIHRPVDRALEHNERDQTGCTRIKHSVHRFSLWHCIQGRDQRLGRDVCQKDKDKDPPDEQNISSEPTTHKRLGSKK